MERIRPTLRKENLTAEQYEYNLSRQREYRMANIFQIRFYAIKQSGKDYTIDVQFLDSLFKKQNGKCFYSGMEFINGKNLYSLSVERIDSNVGYHQDNVVLVLDIFNRMKRNLPFSEFIEISKKILDYNGIKYE